MAQPIARTLAYCVLIFTGVTGAMPWSKAPIVDLGYAVHQGSTDGPSNYYSFSNIRYGEVKSRFRAPSPPARINRNIVDGQSSTRCPQAHPAWLRTAAEVALGVPTSQLTVPEFNASQIPPKSPEETEDCLFLDVFVPRQVFNHSTAVRAPVLVWIDGGGFSAGYKDEQNPTGLLEQSQTVGQEGLVYVSMNYRVGLFGFLPASISGEGDSNGGLLDQRLALEWVQKYIHLFGGDLSRVTIMGESAGGGSVLHQITAFGGSHNNLFQQAIMQSPGFQPNDLPGFQLSLIEDTTSTASTLTNKSIRTVEDLRLLTFEELYILNSVMVGRSSYGTYTFGPVVDGTFVPDLPSHLIAQGRFSNSLNGLLMGTNYREGVLFDSPFLTNDLDYRGNIRSFFKNMTDDNIDHVATTLYPNDLSGRYNYTTQPDRAAITTAEGCFSCNTRYLIKALPHLVSTNIFKYLFAVSPAIHADDLAYTFYNGNGSKTWEGLPVDEKVAMDLQKYIVSFALTGSPNSPARVFDPRPQEYQRPWFPAYGANSTVLLLNTTDPGSLRRDAHASPRCDWWQSIHLP